MFFDDCHLAVSDYEGDVVYEASVEGGAQIEPLVTAFMERLFDAAGCVYNPRTA